MNSVNLLPANFSGASLAARVQSQPGQGGARANVLTRGSEPQRETMKPVGQSSALGQELTSAEQQQVRELQQRDAHVRQHEAAHVAAAGPYVEGVVQYEYQRGPDGKVYAVGGEVSIDTSPEDDPRATIRKMRVVQAAALAPADPSAQDRAIAAAAAREAAKARIELMNEKSQQASQQANPAQRALTGRFHQTGVPEEPPRGQFLNVIV